MTARGLARGLGALVLAASLAAHAVEIELKSAWMRPAAAGSDARAYVDIVSDTALALVGAESPLARRVEVVVVQRLDGEDPGRVVEQLPVSAGAPTRLAYKGNHLRLVGLREDVANGRPVPVTLAFRDARGRRYRAATEIQVRGLLAPRSIAPPEAGASPGLPAGAAAAPLR